MKSVIFLFLIVIGYITSSHVETTVTKEGNQLVVRSGGPFDYHIDLTDPYKLVDGSNQLMAIGTKMIHHKPSKILDIGFGMGNLPRYFIHNNKHLSVEATDLDFRVIQRYAEVRKEYMPSWNPSEETLKIYPSDGKKVISQIFSNTKFDIVWLDILDDNYVNPDNLLFDNQFFYALRKRITDHGGVIIALNNAKPSDLTRIKKDSGMYGIHLTFAQGDPMKQAEFSVLILTNDYKLNCNRLDSSFAGSSFEIRKPSCKIV